MYLDNMTLRHETRFFHEAGEGLDKPGGDALFDGSTCVANGQNRRLVRAFALAGYVGLEGFHPVNASGLGKLGKCVVNRRRRDLGVCRLKPMQDIIGGHGAPRRPQQRQYLFPRFLATFGHETPRIIWAVGVLLVAQGQSPTHPMDCSVPVDGA